MPRGSCKGGKQELATQEMRSERGRLLTEPEAQRPGQDKTSCPLPESKEAVTGSGRPGSHMAGGGALWEP